MEMEAKCLFCATLLMPMQQSSLESLMHHAADTSTVILLKFNGEG